METRNQHDQPMKEVAKRVSAKKILRSNKGGFTLAELLVVVGIILVLVAIAIPVFMGAMDKSYEATAEATLRTAKAAAANKYVLDGETRQNSNGDTGYIATFDEESNLIKIEYTPWYIDDTYLWQIKDWVKNGRQGPIEVTVHVNKVDLGS